MRKGKMRCSRTRLLEDMQRYMMKRWRHFPHIAFVFSWFHLVLLQVFTPEAFLFIFWGNFVWWLSLRSIAARNKSVVEGLGRVGVWWQESGLLWYRRWLFTSINLNTVICCSKTLPSPQEEALKRKQATASVRVSVRACVKYWTCSPPFFLAV